ncbi:MAG: hypothetical protein AB1540_01610 [Bdellovibrionota bacterium]
MSKKVPAKTKDLPATHGMLLEVRDELKASIHGVKKDLEGVKKDLEGVKSDLQGVKNDLKGVKNELGVVKKGLEAKIEAGFFEMKSLFHQALLRFEEQRSENKIVLEALQGLAQRQDRLESEFIEVRDTVRSLAKAKHGRGRA